MNEVVMAGQAWTEAEEEGGRRNGGAGRRRRKREKLVRVVDGGNLHPASPGLSRITKISFCVCEEMGKELEVGKMVGEVGCGDWIFWLVKNCGFDGAVSGSALCVFSFSSLCLSFVGPPHGWDLEPVLLLVVEVEPCDGPRSVEFHRREEISDLEPTKQFLKFLKHLLETMPIIISSSRVQYVLDPNLPPLPEITDNDSNETKAARKKREEDELVCRGHILNALLDRLYDLFTSSKCPKEIWKALENKYNNEKQGADKFLTLKYFEFTMNDSESVLDRVHQLQILVSKLKDLKVEASNSSYSICSTFKADQTQIIPN
ncbi:hypothetical protein RJ639_024661 [Escallonia herrerae]|uniref:Uncharacterized protein n=1 Tax=Escallonia herrerae TaxID=1293975 RepID=A0AA88V095_9ASTE|nr:hypothetical protein RJ639_024661 [Escallonia herrerae]